MASESSIRSAGDPGGTRRRSEGAVIRVLPFVGDDASLVEALRSGQPAAATCLHERFAASIHRMLYRILGPDPELEDAVHDTFVHAFQSIRSLRDPGALKSWIMGIAVLTAKQKIQKRVRRRWLRFLPPEDMPEPSASEPVFEANEAVREIYRILQLMRPEERIAVVLHFVERMTTIEASQACNVSPSTFKRRLKRGERTFLNLARGEPALRDWLEEGSR